MPDGNVLVYVHARPVVRTSYFHMFLLSTFLFKRSHILKYWSYDILSMRKRISSIFTYFLYFLNLFCWQIWNFWKIKKSENLEILKKSLNFPKKSEIWKSQKNRKSQKSRFFFNLKIWKISKLLEKNLKNLRNLKKQSENLKHFENKFTHILRIENRFFPRNRNFFFSSTFFFLFKISRKFYFEHSFMSTLHFCAFVPKCWISIFDLGSQISDLPPDSQISFRFSDFLTCFLDFSLSFQYIFYAVWCKRSGFEAHNFLDFQTDLWLLRNSTFTVQKRD